jgi:DNA (cytosine-5)-methyltransferase 1
VTLTKLSLFSGIGGDDLASEWAGIETVCFVEIDKYCQKVLKRHWPDIPIIEKVQDVTKEKVMAYARLLGQAKCEKQTTGIEQHSKEIIANTSSIRFNTRGTEQSLQGIGESGDTLSGYTKGIDIISGGFPCQPHSVAGKRKGSLDERNLWPEFRRIISEIKSRWVVAENVPGLFSSDAGRFFGEVLADMAALGYSAGWCTYGAVDVGALHRRNRVFIVAHTINSQGTGTLVHSIFQGLQRQLEARDYGEIRQALRNKQSMRCNRTGEEYWLVEPNVGRVAHGISSRVDRLKGLGNAVVPQQIYPIYKAIVEIEKL